MEINAYKYNTISFVTSTVYIEIVVSILQIFARHTDWTQLFINRRVFNRF